MTRVGFVLLLVLVSLMGTLSCEDGKETTPTPISGPTFYPEEYVLSELLDSSPEFAAFYEAERNNITQPLYWAHHPSIPTGYEAVSTIDTIFLRRVPVPRRDDFIVAHELAGFLLDAKGFPGVGTKNPKFINVSALLTDIVWTPLRDSRLEPYGFDLQQRYEEMVNEYLSSLHGHSWSDATEEEAFISAFNYAKTEVYWEYTLGKGTGEVSPFRQWFLDSSNWLGLVDMGDEILANVQAIGFDTPEQMETLFTSLIEWCGPQWQLVIVYPTSR